MLEIIVMHIVGLSIRKGKYFMLYLTKKGNLVSLSYVLKYLTHIKYFTVSKQGSITCDPDGNNPRFKEWIYSDEIEYQRFLEDLEPYKIKEFSPKNWFMRPEVSDRFKDQYFYRVLVYEFNETTKNILLKNTLNVVFRDQEDNLLHLPEDLCFFDKECKLLMATLSHMDYLAMIKTKSMDDMKLREYEFQEIDEEVVIPSLDL